MGALDQFLKVRAPDAHHSEPFDVGKLTLTWFEKAADGYHIDRSTNEAIGQMGKRRFRSMEAAKSAVIAKARSLSIDEKYLLFPQLIPKS